MAYNAANAVSFCQRQMGRYRDGECWTLMEDAVVGAGGRSSRSLTPHFSAHASFVWGTAVTISSLQAGDILQFSQYSWTRTIVTEVNNPDGSGSTDEVTDTQGRGSPQHSAIVLSVVSPGVVQVIEQNVPRAVGPVQTVTLVLSASTPSVDTSRTRVAAGGERVTTVTTTDVVTSAPRCYRPVSA